MPRRKKEFNKSIFETIRKYNGNASDVSIRTYTANIEKLIRDLKGDTSSPNASLFENYDNIISLLDSQKLSLNTYKNKLSSIITFLFANGSKKTIVDKFTNKVDELSGKIEKDNAKMTWNDKEKNNIVKIKELKDYLDIMYTKLSNNPNKYSEYNKYMMYLSGMFHIHYPLRNEFSDMKVYSKKEYDDIKDIDTNLNYIVLSKDKGTVILNKYKTKKTYGTIEFNFDEPYLIDAFNKYYDSMKKNIPADKFNNWLLFKHNYEPFNRNEFTKLMNKTFEATGKNISTSLIRKMVLSELYPVEKMKKLSGIMGHSVKTAINDYVRD